MEIDLVTEAFKFMVLGMGTVFVFITVMIVAMNLQTMFVQKFLPDDPKEPEVVVSALPSKNNKVAAIIAAILKHKQK